MPCMNPKYGVQPVKGGKLKFPKILAEARKADWLEKTDLYIKQALDKLPEIYPPDKFNLVPTPCRECEYCLAAKTAEWQNRLKHEQETFHEKTGQKGLFITLTYNNYALPKWGFLEYEDVKKFIKRLRAAGIKLRYFVASEYGTEKGRPHYHIILYAEIEDLVPTHKDKSGHQQYTSETIEKAWGMGIVQIGALDEGGMKYVNNYMLKEQGPEAKRAIQEDWKIKRKQIIYAKGWEQESDRYTHVYESEEHFNEAYEEEIFYDVDSKAKNYQPKYESYWTEDGKFFVEKYHNERKCRDIETGELIPHHEVPPYKKPPPKVNMSTNPGIGYEWFLKNMEKLVRDTVIKDGGKEYTIPTYYQRKLVEHEDEDEKQKLKDNWEARKLRVQGVKPQKSKAQLRHESEMREHRRKFFYPTKKAGDKQ